MHDVGADADADVGGRPVKYVKLYGAGVLLGRGHLICKCSVEAGRLLSLVPYPDQTAGNAANTLIYIYI